MSTDDKYEVGYGKPPRSGQFKKGQSGNPAGRKRCKPKTPTVPLTSSEIYPTRKALVARADKTVMIVEDGQRREVTVREAVLGAMGMSAMRGGVYAQRYLLEEWKAEDEREHAERRSLFDFWWNYATRARRELDDALRRGGPLPNPLPHPADIIFDHVDLTVRFTGPMNEEGDMRMARTRRAALLLLELSHYHNEYNSMPPNDLPGGVVGFWMGHFFALMWELPARMRTATQAEWDCILTRATRRPKAWEAYLRQECDALDLPFIRYTKPWPVFPVKDIFPPGLLS